MTQEHAFLLQRVQPAMVGLVDGSLSTLAPIFGIALATHDTRFAFVAVFLSTPADLVPLVSEPRFLLTDFPLFLALGSVTERHPHLRLTLLCTFSAVGAVAAVAFSRGAWIA